MIESEFPNILSTFNCFSFILVQDLVLDYVKESYMLVVSAPAYFTNSFNKRDDVSGML